MRSIAHVCVLVLLAACGGGGGSESLATLRENALRAALLADGFSIGVGSIGEFDISGCCQSGASCFGNNPTSPYLVVSVPTGAGQVTPNPSPYAFRLRADEAVIYVGTTPPEAAYFGYTPYVFDRDNGAGTRVAAFASLSETLNHEVIGVEGAPGVFGKPVVVIACADLGVETRVRAALAAAGFPPVSVNTLVLDPALARFGLDAAADTFGLITRVALPADAAALDAYRAAVPGFVWRLTPASAVPSPLPSPAARPKNLANVESGLLASVLALRAAILLRYTSAYDATDVPVVTDIWNPVVCLSVPQQCLGDNRDTLYPHSDPFAWLGPDDFVVAYGVDHAATGKVTYSSATALSVLHAAGIEAATSRDWAGSALGFLPGNPNAPLLYAYGFAQQNPTANPFLRVVSTASCPDGIQTGDAAMIVFRTYVEPGFSTAPDPATLVQDRVLLFRKKP